MIARTWRETLRFYMEQLNIALKAENTRQLLFWYKQTKNIK